MNSAIESNINDEDSIDDLAAVGSRISLLASDTIDFFQSENKSHSAPTTQSEESLTTVVNKESFNGQPKQMNCLDHNKNSFTNSYIAINGNKDKPVINGNKEKFILNGSKEKIIEDGIQVPKTLLYTGKIHVEWKQVHKIGAGLNNLGNTCFMNTVIQCLTYCPPLANYLLHDNDHPSKCTITGFCMMCLLQKHMKRTIGKSGDIIKPVDVYQRLKLIAKHFQFGRQEDAHEFLRYVIDNLVKSCLCQNNGYSKLDPASKETTVINQIFGGYHRSQVTCTRCKGKSNTFDHFMDFILDIKQNVLSLEKALEKFIQPELLEHDNSYKCPKCKVKVTAQKRFTVYRAPNVATFQLKRFDYNRSFGGKITKQISYPEKLNLRPYMSETKGEPVWYRLNAVLVHSGPTCNSGHYYCYVKNSNGFWYIMDDQRVHQVSLTQVLNQSAYVLFYIKATSTEGSAIKKSFENRNAFAKVNSPACNYKKISEISLKSSPLTENNQSRQSSPKLKQHVYPTVNLNKRNGLSPNINREKISFGIRSVALNTQDVSKSASPTLSPAKKVKPFQNTSKTDSNHTGLVPYVEDSSESSDENDNRPINSKVETSHPLSNNCIGTSKLDVSKSSSGNSDNFKANIDVKRKLSNPPLNASRFSNSSSNASTSSKVMATSVWTVTDARVSSPGADSNSSFNSVHSTTDWHVTNADTGSSGNSIPSSLDNKEKDAKLEKPQGNAPLLSNGEKYSPTVNNVNKLHSMPNLIELETPPQTDVGSTSNGTPSSNKQCDFRKQETESNKAFRGERGKSPQKPQQNSFLKRKCSDTDQKFSKNSKFYDNESQYSPLPKKIKCTSDFIDYDTKYSLHDSNKRTDIPVIHNGVESTSQSSKSPYKNFGHSNLNNSSMKTVSHSETTNFLNKSNGNKMENNSRNTFSRCSSSNSSLEYEWVEKTKDKADSGRLSSKGNFFGKEERNYFGSSCNQRKTDQKPDVVRELTNNSNFFYGTSVPTWKGAVRYKDVINSSSEKRKSFDDYEDEYDRGKMRKFRPKDRYQHFRKQNQFHRYADRNYSHHKYENRHYYGHHYDKPYNSHQKWKQNSHHNFQRRKMFKNRFQR